MEEIVLMTTRHLLELIDQAVDRASQNALRIASTHGARYWLREPEAALRFGLTTDDFSRLVDQSNTPCVEIDGNRYYLVNDLVRAMDEHMSRGQ